MIQSALWLREFFSMLSKKLIEKIAIAVAITPPTYIGNRRLTWANTPPSSEPIGMVPHTNFLRVPWIRPYSSVGITV